MREASFILPSFASFIVPGWAEGLLTSPSKTTWQGYDKYWHTIRAARAECVEAFGGLTITKGEGFWKDSDGAVVREPVEVYTVAADGGYEYDHALHRIAYTAAQALEQKAVYVRGFDGNVRIWTIGDMRKGYSPI